MGRVARIRKRTWDVLEAGRSGDALSLFVDGLVMTLVAGNVIAVILESVDSIGVAYHDLFVGFEKASVAVFTAEFVLRLWAAAEDEPTATTSAHPGAAPHDSAARRRFRYLRSPMAIIDVLAIAPFYLSAFFAIDLRFLRVLRLLRIVKLSRYSSALSRMTEVFRMQRSALAAAFFLLSVAVVLSASILHVVESSAQPEHFGSIPDAMWWAVVTLTTVGYGDVTPITPMGKLIASSISIIGIGMVALPTSLFASGFAYVMSRSEHLLEEEAREALADGVITDDEAFAYEELAERLNVEPEVAEEIILAARRKQALVDLESCPHCGKAISD